MHCVKGAGNAMELFKNRSLIFKTFMMYKNGNYPQYKDFQMYSNKLLSISSFMNFRETQRCSCKGIDISPAEELMTLFEKVSCLCK